jgi:hypothetical protein
MIVRSVGVCFHMVLANGSYRRSGGLRPTFIRRTLDRARVVALASLLKVMQSRTASTSPCLTSCLA